VEAHLYEAHDRLEASHWWFEGRRRVIDAVLRRWLEPREGRTLLDVGCGTGGMFPLLQRFGRVEGAEYAAEARERARAKFPGVPVSPCALPAQLPAGAWDVVTAFDVVEHVAEAVESLAAMRARLAAGGQLVLTVPAFQFLWSQHDQANHHLRRYTRGLLARQLEAAGLRLTYASYFNTLLFPVVAAVRAVHRLLPALEGPARADLAPSPPAVNWVLTGLFGAEAGVVSRVPLPYGVSLIAVASAASEP
jgi:2-polyprenyl-3-methyl-5-hydroxy-6-metoxy-1,4-benzoquinol methylase